MFEQAESRYQALQMDRESLDRRAAKAWIAASAVPATERRFSLKAVAVAIAVALASVSGVVTALA
jgi:uncharacterized protein involved in exopolysaccharide biosynthesis